MSSLSTIKSREGHLGAAVGECPTPGFGLEGCEIKPCTGLFGEPKSLLKSLSLPPHPHSLSLSNKYLKKERERKEKSQEKKTDDTNRFKRYPDN